jgi:tetratricopeptide (TPR) repeat protein
MIVDAEDGTRSFAEYVSLLRRLHGLIAEGKSESGEADAVRDEMDGPWHKLSEAEMRQARGLSGDLYSLTTDEVYAPEDKSNPVSEPELRAAWESEDYDRVLTLLRHPAPFLTADQIAFMRAHCWGQVGDLETALLFYRRASELKPHDEQYTVMLMLTYLGLGRLADARVCAASLANASTVTMPIILLRAAGVLYASLESLPGSGANEAMAHIVELIERAFEMDRQLPRERRLHDSDRAQYLAVAAVCNIDLGKRREASAACEMALRLDPDNELARTAEVAISHGPQPPGGSGPQERALQWQVEAKERQDRNRVFRDPFVAAGA